MVTVAVMGGTWKVRICPAALLDRPLAT
jgi:hypothetical protein